MTSGMDRIRLAFKAESLERVERLGPMTTALSTTHGPLDDRLEEIRSEVHMMKGAAGMLELPAIRDKVVALEETIETLPRKGPLPGEMSQSLIGDFEGLKSLLDQIGE